MQPHLHWSFQQEHVLLDGLVLRSFTDFLIVALSLIIVCLFERFLSFKLEDSQTPRFLLKTRWGKYVWRSILYWAANFLRLCYMLAAMTLQIGIIIVIVTSLTLGQLLIECYKSRDGPHPVSELREDAESRTSLIPSSYPLHPVMERIRPRLNSRPHDIVIHPLHSNIACADAVASQMGINKETEDMQHPEYENLAWGARECTLKAQGDDRNSVKSLLISGSDSDSESRS